MAESVSSTAVQPAARAAAQSSASKQRQEGVTGLIFIAPALFILVVFLIIPLFAGLYFSLTDWDGITPLERGITSETNERGAYEIVGAENYARLLTQEGTRQESFYTSVKNTVYYVLGVVPIQTLLALVLAVIVNQQWLRGRGFFRTAFYFPSITSSVVISLIFIYLFQSNGIVNLFLRGVLPSYDGVTWLNDPNGLIHNFLGLFGITRDTAGAWARTELASIDLWDWISGPSVTMTTIMFLAIWTTTGTMMIIYLAALQGISPQVYEAATVDGANAWQTFRRITVPLLRPTTFFVLTIGLIGAFQVFDQVFVISNGGPANTTLTIAYLVYKSGFTDARMGLASATAIVLFIIIFVFTILQRRFVSDRAN